MTTGHLNIGDVVLFRWKKKRRPWQKQAWGVLQVLGFDADGAVCHICVKTMEDDNWPFLIGHMPISTCQIEPFVEKTASSDPRVSCWGLISAWRTERSKGRAGYFNIPLPQAIEKALETVNEGKVCNPPAPIESAYPVRGHTGRFNTVYASMYESI